MQDHFLIFPPKNKIEINKKLTVRILLYDELFRLLARLKALSRFLFSSVGSVAIHLTLFFLNLFIKLMPSNTLVMS